jgi:hypothetical protein
MRRRALYAVPRFQQVVCTYSSWHRPPPTSVKPVLADLSTIPKKYHVFISSSLRRVFLAEEHDSSRAVIDSLKSEITTLKRDKESLSKDLLESRSIISHLSSTERAARLASDKEKERACIDLEKAKGEARVALNKAKEETRVANERLEELRAEYDKSQ